MSEEIAIEIAKLQREALDKIRARIAAQCEAECFNTTEDCPHVNTQA